MALYDFGAIAMNLGSGNPPDPVKVVHVSADYFKVFGVSPMAGRSFSEAEDLPRGPAVAIIGYGLWQSRFGGASDVLGRPLLLNGTPYSIVGIMPNGFQADSRGGSLDSAAGRSEQHEPGPLPLYAPAG